MRSALPPAPQCIRSATPAGRRLRGAPTPRQPHCSPRRARERVAMRRCGTQSSSASAATPPRFFLPAAAAALPPAARFWRLGSAALVVARPSCSAACGAYVGSEQGVRVPGTQRPPRSASSACRCKQPSWRAQPAAVPPTAPNGTAQPRPHPPSALHTHLRLLLLHLLLELGLGLVLHLRSTIVQLARHLHLLRLGLDSRRRHVRHGRRRRRGSHHRQQRQRGRGRHHGPAGRQHGRGGEHLCGVGVGVRWEDCDGAGPSSRGGPGLMFARRSSLPPAPNRRPAARPAPLAPTWISSTIWVSGTPAAWGTPAGQGAGQ